jgi:hypothetical protein
VIETDTAMSGARDHTTDTDPTPAGRTLFAPDSAIELEVSP